MLKGRMARRLSRPSWALALLLLSCGEPGDQDRAFDGGRAIDRRPPIPGLPEIRGRDPCWRQERGGWHSSVVHCTRMASPERMTGIWITGFEEQSFIPNATALPDPNDPRRYRNEIELDHAQVRRLMGREFGNGYSAIAISFIGRRTLYPYNIGCSGQPYYTYTVDRLDSARYLGLMPDGEMPQRPPPTMARPIPRSTDPVLRRLEDEAAAHCGWTG